MPVTSIVRLSLQYEPALHPRCRKQEKNASRESKAWQRQVLLELDRISDTHACDRKEPNAKYGSGRSS
jgi:hypothetical protein